MLSSADRAEEWFAHLEDILYEVMPPVPKNRGDRIKIALLDTGIDMTDYYISLKVNSRRLTYLSFVKGDKHPSTPTDDHGHGTHVAALTLKVASNADVYIARVSTTSELTDPQQISDVTAPRSIHLPHC